MRQRQIDNPVNRIIVFAAAALALPGWALLAFLPTANLLGQSESGGFEQFEVATVKTSVPKNGDRGQGNGLSGGPGTDDPGHLVCRNFSLEDLLIWAYRIKRYEVAGPSWIGRARYDITAKIPAGANMAQTHVMLQNLLIARFRMQLHRETREVPGYELSVAKTGLKMRESVSTSSGAQSQSGADIVKDADGSPRLAPGPTAMRTVTLSDGTTRVMARSLPIGPLVTLLGNRLDGVVLDKTALTGTYDFTLDYVPDNAITATPGALRVDGPDLITALKLQLGLLLEPKHIPVSTLVIDSADEKPIDN